MDAGLTGKRALVTGGASGIGLGIARALAQEGVQLVIASRKPDTQAIRELHAINGATHALAADVSTEGGACAMIKEAIAKLGGLDLYVNNAAGAWHEPITKVTASAFQRTIDTNLAACLFACREVGRHFISQRSGSIVVVGSTSRLTPGYGEVSYRISKAGLKVIVQNLAMELAPWGIRVNMLTPGHFPTRLTAGIPEAIEGWLKTQIPLRRFGDPLQEVGPAAVLLLSDRLSGYTTGGDLIIDGGLSLRGMNHRSDEELEALNMP